MSRAHTGPCSIVRSTPSYSAMGRAVRFERRVCGAGMRDGAAVACSFPLLHDVRRFPGCFSGVDAGGVLLLLSLKGSVCCHGWMGSSSTRRLFPWVSMQAASKQAGSSLQGQACEQAPALPDERQGRSFAMVRSTRQNFSLFLSLSFQQLTFLATGRRDVAQGRVRDIRV